MLPTEPFPCTVNVAPDWFVNAPANVPAPANTSVPWLSNGAFISPETTTHVWPVAFVIGPAALTVELLNVSAKAAVDRLVLNVIVELFTVRALRVKPLFNTVRVLCSDIAPPPFSSAPDCCVNAPALINSVLPALTVIVPVLVKLGAVPDWRNVRSPADRMIAPEFTCAALGLAMFVGWLTVMVP